MKTVTVSGWKVGFQKVSFTKLLQAEVGYSLSEARSATDSVLENRVVEVSVPAAQYDGLVPRLLELGANAETADGREPKDLSRALELTNS